MRTSVTVQRSPLRTQPPSQRAEAAVVAPGDDEITDRGAGSIGKVDFAAGVGIAVEDALGAGAGVEAWTDRGASVTSTLSRPARVSARQAA